MNVFGEIDVNGSFFFPQRKRGGVGVTSRWPRMVDLKGRRMCNERSTRDSGESFDMRERRELEVDGDALLLGVDGWSVAWLGRDIAWKARGTPVPIRSRAVSLMYV
jgi:hypothetical protein